MSEKLKTYKVNEIKELKIHGRTKEGSCPLALFWTGSGFEANIKAGELWMEVEIDYDMFEQWICVEIDGELMARTMLTKGRYDVCLFRGMNKDIVKNIRIYKEVQPMPNDEKSMFLIHSLKTDGEFEEVEDKKLKIEFIGDSITSGEGTIGARQEDDWIPMLFTAHNNYALMTAKELDADFRIIAQSGWGAVCSWDNNPKCALPKYYEKVCGVISGERNEKLGVQDQNDFESWKPDFIVVNLGTNDNGAFYNDEFTDEKTGEKFKLHLNDDGSYNEKDISMFEKAVVDFLFKIRKYNSEANILWAYGMVGAPLMEYIYEAVSFYKKEFNDKKVSIIQLTDTTDETVGSRKHPGVLCHKAASKLLADAIKNL
ncbi:MAG: SGNH/GDSL hydrolase family protein [Clostridium sp.]|nr:SGNH/GDSL hydrolase family protein [Clostridium sp.]